MQLRLCLQRLTYNQLIHPYFKYYVLGENLGRLVKRVDLDLGDDVWTDPTSDHIGLACALRKLPSLTSLRTDVDLLFLHGDTKNDDRHLLETAVEQAAGRVTTLELVNVHQSTLSKLSRLTWRLQHLAFCYDVEHAFDLTNPSWFNRCRDLVSLSIDMVGAYVSEIGPWAPRLMSSVRTIELRSHLPLGDAISYAARLAPEAETLVIHSYQPFVMMPNSPLPPPPDTLPKVRHLTLSGLPVLPIPLASLPMLSLRTFEFKVGDWQPRSARLTFPFVWPFLLQANASIVVLRHVAITNCSASAAAHFATVRPALAAHNIGLSVQTRRDEVDHFAWPGTRWEEKPDVRPLCVEQADAVQATLAWAVERARWLVELGDGTGMQELAEAMKVLRDRQKLDEA